MMRVCIRLGAIGAPPRIAGNAKSGSMNSTALESRVLAARPVTTRPFGTPAATSIW